MRSSFSTLKRTWESLRASIRTIRGSDAAVVVVGLALAVAVRLPLLPFRSADFFNSIKPWYTTIHAMGFAAFGTDFSTYNPPYLYELYLIARFFPDLSNVLAIKVPSLIGDFVGAYFVYKIVALKYSRSLFPLLAALALLFAPTVVLNSAFWGQADILFTAPLIACIYFLMIRRNMLAILAFGIALAFKLQAVFLAPLLLGMALRREISLKHVLAVPLVLFLAILPAWIAGRALLDLILVYAGQVEQFQLLQMNAPTVYAWIPDVLLTQHYFTGTGVIFAAALALSLAVLIYKSPAKLTPPLLLKLALTSVLLVPFFLPKMHDRYFYPADALSIVYAFFFPEYFFVPLVIITSSFFAYQAHLFDLLPVPMGLLALGMFLMLILVAQDAVRALFPAKAAANMPAPQHDLQTESQP
ncbi:MAG TPA: hypothetical protein VF784_11170 [Anaerolineales bacterium]